MVGETPLELHRLRLERAAAHLLTTDASITRLAFDFGYETHEAFAHTFRQAYGTSPSAFDLPGDGNGASSLRVVGHRRSPSSLPIGHART